MDAIVKPRPKGADPKGPDLDADNSPDRATAGAERLSDTTGAERLSDHVRNAPTPTANRPTREQAEEAVRILIGYIGDNPAREGVLDTPRRVVKAYDELYRGYRDVPAKVLERTFSETGDYDDMVLVRDISFTSHCEHHMMPFTGVAHVAYKPVDRVVGLSKLARLVDAYARRLQTQEHMNAQIATAVDEILRPHGVAVMIESEHTCMSLRGVGKPGSLTVTTQFRGSFRNDPAEQSRFLSMIRSGQR